MRGLKIGIERKGQQEIVGFVLIVVLVMVALMVFLIISVRDSGDDVAGSVGVSNMLDVVMKATSDCAIVYEPDYDSFEDLFKSCFKEDSCNNLGVSACDYLNESFMDVVSSIVRSDASVNGWSAQFSERDGAGILMWSDGDCNRTASGAQRSIISGGTSLIVRLRIC